jgi:adenine/guanine/hypoxanthine permease
MHEVQADRVQRELTELDWNDTTEVVPAAVTALMMPFTCSIANGLAFGFISYALVKLFTGKRREVHWMVWVIGGVFLFKFIYVGGG